MRHKDGKTHVYWRLVRSVRRGRKVVQETVAQLGELDAEGCARAEKLAREITGPAWRDHQKQLFDDREWTEPLRVKIDEVRLDRSRSFGAVWLGWFLWRAMKLDAVLGELLSSSRATVRWSEVIAILVIGRLCEPSSELHLAERWYRTTALQDLLAVSPEDIYDERLYRALDRLLPHKQALENTWSNVWENFLIWSTICCFTIDQHLLRRTSRSFNRPARLQPRPSARLRAGQYRAGGESGRDATGL